MAQNTNIKGLWVALLADLRSITVNNGYETTIAETVYPYPEPNKVVTPSVEFTAISSSADEDGDDISGAVAGVRDVFDLKLVAASVAQMLALFSDIRRALGQSDSNIQQECAESVSIDFDADLASIQTSGKVVSATCTIEITYSFLTNAGA